MFYYLTAVTGTLAPRGDYTTVRGCEVLEGGSVPKVGNNLRWVPCEKDEVEKYGHLYTENNVRYLGYL